MLLRLLQAPPLALPHVLPLAPLLERPSPVSPCLLLVSLRLPSRFSMNSTIAITSSSKNNKRRKSGGARAVREHNRNLCSLTLVVQAQVRIPFPKPKWTMIQRDPRRAITPTAKPFQRRPLLLHLRIRPLPLLTHRKSILPSQPLHQRHHKPIRSSINLCRPSKSPRCR